MKKLLVYLLFLLLTFSLVSVGYATTENPGNPLSDGVYFSDDFDNASGLSSDWSPLMGGKLKSIVSDPDPTNAGNKVLSDPSSLDSDRIAINTSLPETYTIEAKVRVGYVDWDSYAGLALYIQDRNNFYQCMFKRGTGFMITRKGGSRREFSAKQSFNFQANTWYTFKCSITPSGEGRLTLTAALYTDPTKDPVATVTGTDKNATFTSTSAGLFSYKAVSYFDDVVVSEGALTP